MSFTSAFVSHQVYLQRLASQNVNELAPFLQQMRDEIRQQVLLFGDDNRTKANLQKLLKSLNTSLYSIAGEIDVKVLDDLQELAEYEASWTAKTMTSSVNAEFVIPAATQVWTAVKFNPLELNGQGVDFNSMLKGWSPKNVEMLTQSVKSGFVRGLTTKQIVSEVAGKGGLVDASQRNLATNVRTMLNYVATTARTDTIESNNDVVDGYEIVSTLDIRTSDTCKSWDGTIVLSTDAKQPKPPFHFGCRTTISPHLSSKYDFLDKGAKRAARGADGGQQVDGDTSYYGFLKDQPDWFQNDALGVTRANIFRDAGMTAEEFRKASVDGFGQPLTLKQMAAKDDKVRAYLGGE